MCAFLTRLSLDIQSLSCVLAVILEYSKPQTEEKTWFFLLSVAVIHVFKGTGVLGWRLLISKLSGWLSYAGEAKPLQF